MPRSDFVMRGKSVALHVIVSSEGTERAHAKPRQHRGVASSQVSHLIRSCARAIAWLSGLVALLLLSCAVRVSAVAVPEAWVPVRWTGGPLELAWRTRAKTLPDDAFVYEALARWYELATLDLLEGSPANCLLVTWSAPIETTAEVQQQQLV